jgi:hypothetical protein
MASVGEFVEQTIDLIDRGARREAIVPVSMAIEATLKRALEKDSPSDADYTRLLKENWELIIFMGMPKAEPLPLNIPFGMKRIIPTFNVYHGALEIVSFIVSDTARFGRVRDEFILNSEGTFEIKGGKLLLPRGLVYGLLGGVVFHPSNKDEPIGDKYWISISDFKMFVSELFGRKELADRIVKFCLE